MIDAETRARLLDRSPFNVVEIDLPESPKGADPYEHAAETLEEWTLQGILTADHEEALWPLEQEYDGPRRTAPHPARFPLPGPGGRLRARRGSTHERTQPGPKEDRLRLTRATRHNLSPIFSLHEGNAWPILEPALDGDPWAGGPEGTVHRVWRVSDPDILAAVTAELAASELLIADGITATRPPTHTRRRSAARARTASR